MLPITSPFSEGLERDQHPCSPQRETRAAAKQRLGTTLSESVCRPRIYFYSTFQYLKRVTKMERSVLLNASTFLYKNLFQRWLPELTRQMITPKPQLLLVKFLLDTDTQFISVDYVLYKY